MVNKKYIEKNINLIFQIEERNIKNNQIFHYVQTFKEDELTKEVDLKRLRSYPYVSPQPILAVGELELSLHGKFRLNWETYENLKKLYNKIERVPGCRSIFINIIERKLSKVSSISTPSSSESLMVLSNSKLHGNASLAFYFLLKTGNCDVIIRALEKKLNDNMYPDTVEDISTGEYVDIEIYTCENDIVGLFRDILMFMHFEPIFFNEPLLDLLSRTAFNCFPSSLDFREKFIDKILLLKYDIMKTQLETFNEELNIHKEQVIGIISKYGFPPEMEKFLLEIDELPELSNWQSVNSGMIGNLRSFLRH